MSKGTPTPKPAEAVLATTNGYCVRGEVAYLGTLSLTERRLAFVPDDPSTGARGMLGCEVAVDAVQEATLATAGRYLLVHTGEEAYRFGGRDLEAVHRHLNILLRRRERSALVPWSPPGWDAALEVGRQGAAGRLWVEQGKVRFEPSGGHDGAQAPSIAISAADVQRLAATVDGPERVVFAGRDRVVALRVPSAVEVLRETAVQLIGSAHEGHAFAAGTPIAPESVLAAWQGAVAWGAAESVRHAELGVHWVDMLTGRLGWAFVTDQRLLFLPMVAPGLGEDPVLLPLDAVMVSRPDGREGQRVCITGDGGTLLLTLRSSARFVSALGGAGGRASLSGTPLPVAGGQTGASVIGEAPFLRLSRDGEVLCEFGRTRIVETSEDGSSLGIVFPGVPDRLLDIGAAVRVEVVRDDGVYVFDTRVWWIDRLPVVLRARSAAGALLLLVERPTEVRRFNRRQAFRVGAAVTTRCRIVVPAHTDRTAPQRFSGCLVDLSATGCGLATEALLPPGTIVNIELPLYSGPLTLKAEVVQCRPPLRPGHSWRHGLRFCDPTPIQRRRVWEEVMERHREALRSRSETEPAGRGTGP